MNRAELRECVRSGGPCIDFPASTSDEEKEAATVISDLRCASRMDTHRASKLGDEISELQRQITKLTESAKLKMGAAEYLELAWPE